MICSFFLEFGRDLSIGEKEEWRQEREEEKR
jgi:hypothetical protein